MTSDQIRQQFIDFFTAAGTLPERVDVAKYLQAY